MVSVAFQGERGAYSEEAALEYFGSGVELYPMPYLSDVFKAVENGMVDMAIVPIENTIEGSVSETYDLLLRTTAKIVGEHALRISHCFMILSDSDPSEVVEVWSHPQALSQCRGFIESRRLRPVPYYDTAGSAKMIREMGMKKAGAIASCRAAEYYGLKVVERGIEDSKNNFTRFIVLGKDGAQPTGRDKTTVIFGVRDRPGALYYALKHFAENGINLTKIESRPTKDRPWEYYFFIDFDGHLEDERVKQSLDALKREVTFLKILGSYKKVV